MIRWIIRVVVVLGVLAFAAPVSAHPGKRPHKHGPKTHRRHQRPGADKKATPLTPKERAKRFKRIRQRAKERRKNRRQRRKDRRQALRKRLKKKLKRRTITKEVRFELRVHARRVARLRRIRAVAAAKDDTATVERCDKLLARENARHENWWRVAANKAAKKATK